MRRLLMLMTVVALAMVASGCGDDGPSADAGADFSTAVGSTPRFDGCGSSGDIVNYAWTITGAPSSMATDVGKALREESSECSFVLDAAMLPTEVGVWTVELEVTDADGETSTDEVEVEVTP